MHHRLLALVDPRHVHAAAGHHGPIATAAGLLERARTVVLFGGSPLNSDVRSGGRLQIGGWLDRCETIGVEGEYLALAEETTHFRDWSSGDPILSRPFYDVTRPASDPQNVEKVAFPRGDSDSLDGSVSVDALTRFQSAGARLRFCIDCGEDCCSNPYSPQCGISRSWHTDFLLGYRFMRLDDGLAIREELTSTDLTAPGAFLVQDQFGTENQFHGAEMGLAMVVRAAAGRWRWSPRLPSAIPSKW